jgi:hypothetical protein
MWIGAPDRQREANALEESSPEPAATQLKLARRQPRRDGEPDPLTRTRPLFDVLPVQDGVRTLPFASGGDWMAKTPIYQGKRCNSDNGWRNWDSNPV